MAPGRANCSMARTAGLWLDHDHPGIRAALEERPAPLTHGGTGVDDNRTLPEDALQRRPDFPSVRTLAPLSALALQESAVSFDPLRYGTDHGRRGRGAHAGPRDLQGGLERCLSRELHGPGIPFVHIPPNR